MIHMDPYGHIAAETLLGIRKLGWSGLNGPMNFGDGMKNMFFTQELGSKMLQVTEQF